MPTIVDALVITLGLESSGFKKGGKEITEEMKKQKKEAEKLAKDMAEQGKKAGAFFGNIRNELLALVGISLSIKGFKDLIIGTATNFAQLGRSSNMLGMSAKRLDAWQYAAKAFGGTAEGLVGTMSSLSQGINSFALTGEANGVVTALNALGVAATDKDGKLRTSEDILMDLSDKFKAMTPQQTQYFSSMLGIDAGTMNLLMQGRDGVKAIVDELARSSGVTDDAIKRSQKFQVTWSKIDQKFSSVRENLFTALIPHIEKLLGLLDRFATWVSSHQEEINAFFTNTATEFSNIVEAVGGVKNALTLLLLYVAGSWIAGMLSAVGKVSGALGGIPALVTVAGGYVAAIAGNEVIERIKALSEGREYDQIQGHSAEMNELERLKRRNWAVNNPNTPYPEGEPVQHAQAAKATGKGKALLDWMSGQFGKLEAQYGLPTGLLRSVATTESGGNQFAVGPKTKYGQAKGLFQFMDPTASSMGLKGNDVYDPEKSANAAAKYLSQLLKATGGDLSKALGAYNWGIGNVQKKGLGNAPLETLNYIPKVLNGMPMGAQVSAQRSSNESTRQTTTITNESHVGQMIIQPKSNDGPGIGREIRSDLQRNGLVFNTDSGMS
ncbi:lytic transglycosylase domain-containing protein [Yersinia mollaretii]|uniref:lytic transglycosylase domain-containing protein n=1 Tax=Yersinia mollaretii TaxID=33060 RepID=UPI0016436B30|nr:transglycosylase SLT domain-containing protein [Yersinia mollaretii]